MDAPVWLTSDLVQKFIGEGAVVGSFTVESATKPGDNFLSTIYRVHITCKSTPEQRLSLIVKSITESPSSMELITVFQVFPKETIAYKDLLPEFERLWLSHAGGEGVSFGPKCYYTTEEPLALIVMDDLRPQGYAMRDRKEGLNVRESKMVLEKVAKLHACSVKRLEENGSGTYGELFEEGLARQDLSETFSMYYGALFGQFILGVENNVKNGSKYVDKLRKWQGRQFEQIHKLTLASPDQFTAYNHCDLWVNNLLFNGTPEDSTDVKFIDFQISQWTSPSVDLMYFFFNSCPAKIIIEEMDNLIGFYHGELVKCMEVLNCATPVLSLEDLLKDFNKRGLMGAMMLSESVALMKADSSLNLDIEALTAQTEEAEELKKLVFAAPEYIEMLDELLPYLDKRGFLDIVE